MENKDKIEKNQQTAEGIGRCRKDKKIEMRLDE